MSGSTPWVSVRHNPDHGCEHECINALGKCIRHSPDHGCEHEWINTLGKCTPQSGSRLRAWVHQHLGKVYATVRISALWESSLTPWISVRHSPDLAVWESSLAPWISVRHSPGHGCKHECIKWTACTPELGKTKCCAIFVQLFVLVLLLFRWLQVLLSPGLRASFWRQALWERLRRTHRNAPSANYATL
jgi:hypothetical protein